MLGQASVTMTFYIVKRLTKKQQSKVRATQMNVLRRIEGVNRLGRVRNVHIRERLIKKVV